MAASINATTEGYFLVRVREPAVASLVGGKVSGEPALNAFLDHARSPGHVPTHILRDVARDEERWLKRVRMSAWGHFSPYADGSGHDPSWGMTGRKRIDSGHSQLEGPQPGGHRTFRAGLQTVAISHVWTAPCWQGIFGR